MSEEASVFSRRGLLAMGGAAALVALGYDLVPASPAMASTSMYNPFSAFPVTGSWTSHAAYSAGGIDYPLAYGKQIPAPGPGTLRISGGSGNSAAGWVGSAGRRSILELDSPAPRIAARSSNPAEGSGDMVAVVFQHQSAFGQAKHYSAGEVVGWSGASANGSDRGGDVHLHIHGLNAAGQRVDFLKFVTGGIKPPQQEAEEDMQLISVFADNGANWGGNYGSTAIVTAHRGFVQTSTGLGSRAELEAWLAIAGALGFQIIEKHVDKNGFELAKRL